MSRFLYFLLAVALFALPARMEACTGIALSSANGARVLARTVEWAASPMQCGYAVVPRGYSQISFTPSGKDGLKFKAKYGYVGIYTDYQDFVVEGVNESGLSAGLFFFPAFGEYAPYVAKRKSLSLCDLQVVSWVLSQFSSIDEIKSAIEKKEVEVLPFLEKVKELTFWRLQEKKLSLEISCTPEDLTKTMDQDLMMSLVMNLVDNAVKASKEGRKIWIRADERELSVRDEGKGIPLEDLARVTEAFYMVDKARARSAGSVGLGLAICEEIAMLHGARLSLESEEGKGTCVHLF